MQPQWLLIEYPWSRQAQCMYLICVRWDGCHGCTSSHTYGQSHDLQLVPHQFDYHALLQRRGAAAEHRTAAPCHSQELVLQTFVEGVGQSAPIDHQAETMHHEGGGLPGGGGGGCGRGGIRVEGCEAGVVGLGGLLGSAAEELGLEIVQTLLQQQGTRLLVQRQTQGALEFSKPSFYTGRGEHLVHRCAVRKTEAYPRVIFLLILVRYNASVRREQDSFLMNRFKKALSLNSSYFSHLFSNIKGSQEGFGRGRSEGPHHSCPARKCKTEPNRGQTFYFDIN